MREAPDADERALDRLTALSDGVFAIAMTLLVVGLAAPEVLAGPPTQLGSRLWALWPAYLSYAISFAVIASYWRGHQRVIAYARHADDRFTWLTLLLLACVAFQPFPTLVLGVASDQPAAVTFFALTQAATGCVLVALWLSVRSPQNRAPLRSHLQRAVCVPLVFLFSIALAWLNPTLAELSWLLLVPLLVVLRRRAQRSSQEPVAPAAVAPSAV